MAEKSTPLQVRLLYLQLGSPEPERLATFYADIFGWALHRMEGGWSCRGANSRLAFSEGASNTLLSAGYAVTDPGMLQHLARRAATTAVSPGSISAEFFQPGAVACRDPDGNPIVYGLPTAVIAEEATSVPPARLQHLVLGSTNAARMRAFYTNVIGLRESDEVLDEHGNLRTSFMRSDDEHHSFAVFQTSANKLDHHCYELRDWNAIRDWGDRLAERRVTVEWGPGRHGPGNNLFLFFNDPDGNWVEVSAELERVREGRPRGTWRHEERTLNKWGRGYLRS
jgi:catechol 2,3-dioxygenase-like lactoylglutathione lyase family enzyme